MENIKEIKEVKIKPPKIISVGDLLKTVWSEYSSNWEKFGIILIIPLTLSFLINIILYLLELYAANLNWLGWLVIGILAAIVILAFAILYFVSYITQFLLLKDLNQEVSFSNLKGWLAKSWPYVWTVAAVSIVYGIFSLVGFICLIIPGIMVMVYYCFAIYFVIFEENKFEGSLGLSRELVRGYWWAVFGRFIVGTLLIYLFYLVVGVFLTLIGWLLSRLAGINIDQSASNLIYSFFSIFIGLVVGPLTIIYTYNIYKSLRVIKK